MTPAPSPRVRRLAETGRAPVGFLIDGQPASALAGDTLLTAILANVPALRQSEFGPEPRAGFCLMGACQDCWVWQKDGPRLRACSTPVTDGLHILTQPPETWP
ncbi:MAG: (2Fe-2S)-binding protein [Pseudooceanicola sp.]|nr:(2Fe-2S)-binding protein [Pseudooceanicola sp.]